MPQFFLRLLKVAQIIFLMNWCSIAFSAPGDLDATFGQHGRVIFDVPGANLAWAYGYFLQSDGKIVAVGYAEKTPLTGPADLPDFLIVRFNPDGSLDTTFNSGVTPGYVRADFGNSTDVGLGGVQQPDGKLVIVGYSYVGSPTQAKMAVMRLNVDGTLDNTTFNLAGTPGKAMVTLPGTFAEARDVFLDANGKIVLVGYSTNGTSDLAFARLNSNGVLDTSYGASGILTVDFGGSESISHAVQQADGMIVAVGLGTNTMVATRITTTGALDSAFGAGGKLVANCTALCGWLGVTQQSDGKLLLSGFTTLAATSLAPELPQEQSIVARYNADGSVDTSFGTNGQLVGVFAGTPNAGVSLAGERAVGTVVDSTGAISILGNTTARLYANGAATLATLSPSMARVSSSGVLDTSFGRQGVTVIPFSSPTHSFNNYTPGHVTLLGDGKLLVSSLPGQFTNGQQVQESIAFARLLATGSDPGAIGVTALTPVTENVGSALLRLTRYGGATGNVSVTYTTTSGTAVAGSDFTSTTGTVTWTDGDTDVKFVAVPIIADSILESSDKTFTFSISNATGGAAIDAGPISITIARDDVAPSVLIALSQPTLSVSEGVGNATVTVTRTGTAPVSVIYYTANGSAKFGTDVLSAAGVLGWGSGDTSMRTINVPIINDTINEPSKDFYVVITSAGGGAVYGNQATLVTINDDDPLQVGFGAATASVNESQSSVTLNVSRVGVTTQTMSVSYSTANGTATAGSDYTATSGTITWLPSDPDTKTITIPLLPDTVHEGDETFNVTLSNPTSSATLGTATATVTIVDDDPIPSSSGGGGAISISWLGLLSLSLLFQLQGRIRAVRR